MTGERNRATILRFFGEVMGAGDLDALDELAVEDYVDHVALPGQGPGRAGLKWRVATLRGAFQPRQRLHDVIVDADRVAVRWTLCGTHSAPFLGLPATGKPVEFDGVDLYVMRNGRMAGHWRGQADDGGHNGVIALVMVKVGDEPLVNLHDVDGKAPEVIER